ncbi:Lrp/AsnC ligand binding domain-containing protein [Natronocalculus amylovorans]|uniref:Lrp/AsnC ligand binding domain-containing protein n=1 Tax=Natronocalculus amylovorans TaxID=2917812 RepID=A0AAE3FWU8_9EURY|nr:Lrp/AsnC ligand binding domain-containing protein [Natronocalculus amylovorans]MCL9816468.1 Lrp/AsnC ligand binding domain-containing protein [Natronocalculus amylovorans]NUE00914.1 Lrp/AsnC ligand binding domain-containing protein [Halorubraceae archaeon YAN]
MVHAFIMVKTHAASSADLLGLVRELSPVTEAHIVAGAYDIIVEVESEGVYEVLQTAASEIQSFDGVADTKTYISLED